ncbi:MAG: hypothetical protein GDA36_05655 [Rhodobacteraceae bacterium]|nr:hypothetical protein [Paracoccaceae bacterium]
MTAQGGTELYRSGFDPGMIRIGKRGCQQRFSIAVIARRAGAARPVGQTTGFVTPFTADWLRRTGGAGFHTLANRRPAPGVNLPYRDGTPLDASSRPGVKANGMLASIIAASGRGYNVGIDAETLAVRAVEGW